MCLIFPVLPYVGSGWLLIPEEFWFPGLYFTGNHIILLKKNKFREGVDYG